MVKVLEKSQIVVKNGRPQAIILDIKEYEKLLNLAEEKMDLAELYRIKKGKKNFRPLENFINDPQSFH